MSIVHWSKYQLKRALSALAQQYNTFVQPLPPSTWRLTVDARGHLLLDGLDLAELNERWGSPLHVVSAEAVRQNAAAFLDASDGAAPCEVYYSYKTNPVPAVLELLHTQGIGAEVISAYELWLALRLGVPPERIVYNGPAKSLDSLTQAIEKDILLINANHREEIAVIGALAQRLGKRPRVGVRVSTSGSWSGQFGCSIASGEAEAALREACEHPSLDVCALHAHLGAPIRSESQVQGFVRELLDFSEHSRHAFGFALQILDLGGSLAIPSVTSFGNLEKRLNMAILADLLPPEPSATLGIRDYVRCARTSVQECAERTGQKAPRIFLEPGRAMTGSTQFLIATVLTTKCGGNGPPFAILDAGINLAQSAQTEYHQILHATKMHSRGKRSYRIAGPICSPGDVLYWACSLPTLSPGDSLVIADAGAYFVPFSTSFSFPQPAIVMADGGAATLVRRSQTFEDLVMLDEQLEPEVPC